MRRKIRCISRYGPTRELSIPGIEICHFTDADMMHTFRYNMFRYFPTNYVWNLSVDIAIEMGARIGEIEEMCAPLLEASKQPDAEGTRAFAESWVTMGEKLCSLAA